MTFDSSVHGWLEVELGDVCELAYGKSLPAKSRSGSGYPVYGSNGEVGQHDQPLTDGATIIVGRKGSFGKVHYSAGPCSPIDTTYYVTEKQTDACLPWLARRLRCLGLDRLNRSAAVPGLNREDAYRQRLLLPPLAEQKRIAALLDAADALRAQRRQSLEQLDALTQSVFLDMFGDPVTNPKGWDMVPITDAVLGRYGIKAGPFGSSLKKEDYVESGFRVYGQEQVIAGRFDIGDYYVDQQKFEKLQSCAVAAGDVLVSLVGSYGKVLVVPEGIEPGIINPRLLKITPRQELVTSLYLATLIQSEAIQRELARMSHGGTMGILNAGLLKQLAIPTPLLDLQHRFATLVDAIETQRSRLSAHLDELDALFTSLQSRAFAGEL